MNAHAFLPPSLLFWTGVLANFASLGPSDILIVVGALGFAWASFRNGRMKIIRDQNDDLVKRNEFLERELAGQTAEVTRLRAQSNDELVRILAQLAKMLEGRTELFKRITDRLDIIEAKIRSRSS